MGGAVAVRVGVEFMVVIGGRKAAMRETNGRWLRTVSTG